MHVCVGMCLEEYRGQRSVGMTSAATIMFWRHQILHANHACVHLALWVASLQYVSLQ